jgi:hypothetical protein
MGGMESWLADNWFNIVTTVLGGGVWFSGYSIHKDAKAHKEEANARRVANLLAITASHREIWIEFLNNPKLARVHDATADTRKQPVTDSEQVFVALVIVHTNSVFYANKDQLVIEYEGLRRDIAQFFSLPIPKAVWSRAKLLQNHDFVAFVESCRDGK